MSKIRVLDDALVNRIAAGEVVERPASVVKELMENSLDAGASRIDISVTAGGKRSVRVVDDGEGMGRDDAILALERHATSKLRQVEDLESIQSLGFRGEALPSIASVSRFLLHTSEGRGSGTEIEVRGGRILGVRESPATRGTVIEVNSLFFNTPARRKFLKSDATELSHVARVVTRLALVRPDVAIRLAQDGKVLIDAPSGVGLKERIAAIFGAELTAELLPVGWANESLAVDGFVTRPASARAGKPAQLFFVNGRWVQDRMLLHALAEAYANTISRDRSPAAFLFLKLNSALVDINVHPQKSEVRFARPGEIHDALRAAVHAGLSDQAAIPAHAALRPSIFGGVTFETARSDTPPFERALSAERPANPYNTVAKSAPPVLARSLPASLIVESEEGKPTRVLAQYDDSYILAADDQGLLVVDQHAAHERVLFERYLAEATADRVDVQRLLFPRTLELAPQDALLVDEAAPELARLGFVVAPFGPGTVRLDGVPAVAAAVDPESLFRGVLADARRARSVTAGVAELRHALVTSAACQAAIKIHHRLTLDGMQQLVDDLMRMENPTTCPHGRPILFRLTQEEIERTFRRR